MNAFQRLLKESDHLETPTFVTLKPSTLHPGKLGVFANTKLPSNYFVGHYKGKMRRIMPLNANMDYLWTILGPRNSPIYYIDATFPRHGNFTRYVRWRPVRSETNVISLQQGLKIAYFTSRDINPGEELVIFVETDSGSAEQMTGRKRKSEFLNDINTYEATMKIFLDSNKDDWNNCLNSGKFSLCVSPRFLTRSSSGRRMLMCELCNVNFYTNISLRRHFHLYHINEAYLELNEFDLTCPVCASESGTDVKLTISSILDPIDRWLNEEYLHLFKCYLCFTHYNSYDALKLHLDTDHPDRPPIGKTPRNSKQKPDETAEGENKTYDIASSPSVREELDDTASGVGDEAQASADNGVGTDNFNETVTNESGSCKSRGGGMFDIEEERFVMNASVNVAQNCKYFIDGTIDDINAANEILTPYLNEERCSLTSLDILMLTLLDVSDEICDMDADVLQKVANLRQSSSMLRKSNSHECYYCSKSFASNSLLLDHEIACATESNTRVDKTLQDVSFNADPLCLLCDVYAEKYGPLKVSCIPPLESLNPLQYPDGKILQSRPQKLLIRSRYHEEITNFHSLNSSVGNDAGIENQNANCCLADDSVIQLIPVQRRTLFVRRHNVLALKAKLPKLAPRQPAKKGCKAKQKLFKPPLNIVTNDYTCPHCLIPFDDLKSLDSHADSGFCFGVPTYDSERQIYRCPICALFYDNGRLIYEHITSTHQVLVSYS